MKWRGAVKATGFAFRDKADGTVSVKAENGQQWTISRDQHVDEVPERYTFHAERYADWTSITDQEFVASLNLYGEKSEAKPVSERKVSLAQLLAQANNLKTTLVSISKTIEESKIEEAEAHLKALINVAQSLLEIL